MATPKVLLKRSSVAGRIPDSSDLSYGELAINFADGKLYYKDDANNVKAFIDSARVQAIADAVEVVASAQLDSGETTTLVTSLIDSNYVQSRTNEAYLATIIDSGYVQLRVPLSYLEGLIDSAYIQARQTNQDFAYSSLTGAPNVLDSTNVTNIIDSAYVAARVGDLGIDSASVNVIINDTVNAGYVQARQDFAYGSLTGAPTTVSTFTNDAGYLTNTTATTLVDSAYVRARVRTDQDLRTTDNVTFNQLRGPANFIIDPAAVGDNTGTVQILGNLQVEGTQTTINSSTVTINARNIVLADSASNAAAADDAGITINGANATLQYAATGDKFVFNKPFEGNYLGFDSDFNAKSTTNLSEGSNLYYTKARADSDIAASLNDSTNTVSITINNTIVDAVDSAYVLARIAEAPFLDSADAIQLIDSAYIRLHTRIGDSDINFGSHKILYSNVYSTEGDLPSATTYHGMFAHVHGTGAGYFAHAGAWTRLANQSEIFDGAYGSLTGTPALIDSSLTIQLIDSAYVQARQTSGGGGTGTVDSAYVLSIIDSTNSPFLQTFFHYTATAGQTTFTGNDDASNTLSYTADAIAVYLNGILLVDTQDYTASNGTSVVLTVAASLNDIITIQKFSGSVIGGGGGTVDSADIIAIVDSDYVQARQIGGNLSPLGAYTQTSYRYISTTGQTVITGSDENGNSLNYRTDQIDVFLNGILLFDSADYTQTNSTTLTMTSALDSADDLNIIWRRGQLVRPNVKVYEYTATASQSTFSGADLSNETLSYVAGAVQIFVNGILLKSSTDYTATNGTSVLLTSPAGAGDDIAIAAYAAPAAKATSFTFTADSAQAVFSGVDNKNNNFSYEVNNSLVFLNGIVLNDSDDFTASNGTSVTLTTAANLNDELKVVSFGAITTTQSSNNWSETTTSIKISPNEKKFVDCSNSAIMLEIQDSNNNVSMGDELRIIDGYGNAANNNITLRSTKKIIGSDSDLIIDINRSGTNLVYYNESNGWVLIEN